MGDSLTSQTIRGIGWISVASILAKLMALAAQLVYARLLSPDEYGLFALASSITAVLSVLQQGGVSQILISRPKAVSRLLGPGLTASICLGTLAAALLLASTPVLVRVFGEPRLPYVLPFFAVSIVFASICSPATACIQSKMNYQRLSMIEVVNSLVKAGLGICLVVSGFGVYSLLLPVPVVAGFYAIQSWRACGEKFRISFSPRLIRAIVVAGAPTALAQLIFMTTWHGDYVIVRLFTDSTSLGIYFLAFSLSIQIFSLTSNNITRVLFAGLSQLSKEPVRQTAAFFRAARELALIAFPASFLQIVIAYPAVEIGFNENYQGIAPIIQILSFGLAFRCVGSPAGALLQAQRRFNRLLLISVVYAVLFLSAVAVCASQFGILGAAFGATAYFMFLGPVNVLFCVSSPRKCLPDVIAVFIGPAICGVIALVGALYLQFVVMAGTNAFLRGGVSGCVFLFLYAVLIRLLFPESANVLANRVQPLLRRVVRVGR
ncbi:oligosaccharide flippase family protein [Rhodopirellula sp. MGV]|uniref:oligosaccharide flippase family protein n=1 Tax=Rhodopirellula sp. MGV TaxID=2023130 RepID=UPI000B96C753|nr:oligosaccharide flippase family protein [Rhodopirellula sp. MGV]OYP37322.1 hypothetical protein CGZ80_05460 [Rhodopirellula sp. MGV]PNY36412.1 hypothetical protein C2E31_13340 [Rhodopirellula baltica]